MITSRVVSIMLTEDEINEQIDKKVEILKEVIEGTIKSKLVKMERLIDQRKEPKDVIAITIVLENGKVIKETLDVFETRNKKGQVNNVSLLSTPRIVIMSYLFGYLDSELIKTQFDTLK